MENETPLLLNIAGHDIARRFERIKIKMHWQLYACNRKELLGNLII